jgi:hypothetical protein
LKFYSGKTVNIAICIFALLGIILWQTFDFFIRQKYHAGLVVLCIFLMVYISFLAGGAFYKNIKEDEEILNGHSKNIENTAKQTSNQSHYQPYLDREHPRYSAKLAAAVLVWEAMEDEKLRRGKMPMAAMTAWLEQNYVELNLAHRRGSEKHGYKAGDMNKTAIAEVAKICNWEVDGGAPPTPGS